ncbi:MAG: hemin uptake protein HemP [Planctomycetota bacterium]
MNAKNHGQDRDEQSAANQIDPEETENPINPNLPKIINFETLAKCGEEIWIENNGQIYRLRRTKQGKLILTK